MRFRILGRLACRRQVTLSAVSHPGTKNVREWRHPNHRQHAKRSSDPPRNRRQQVEAPPREGSLRFSRGRARRNACCLRFEGGQSGRPRHPGRVFADNFTCRRGFPSARKANRRQHVGSVRGALGTSSSPAHDASTGLSSYSASRSLETSAHQSFVPHVVQVTLRVVGVCAAKNHSRVAGTNTLRQCGQT